jgi:hypothetical protein
VRTASQRVTQAFSGGDVWTVTFPRLGGLRIQRPMKVESSPSRSAARGGARGYRRRDDDAQIDARIGHGPHSTLVASSLREWRVPNFVTVSANAVPVPSQNLIRPRKHGSSPGTARFVAIIFEASAQPGTSVMNRGATLHLTRGLKSPRPQLRRRISLTRWTSYRMSDRSTVIRRTP